MVDDDPLVKLIKRPNDKQNFQEFGKEFIIFLLSCGWVYQLPYHASYGFERDLSKAGIPGSDGGIQLFNLNPDKIEFNNINNIDSIKDTDIIFKYCAGASNYTYSYSNEIIPYYDILRDKDNPFIGISRLESLEKDIKNYLLAQKAKGNQIKLSGHTIVSPGESNKDQFNVGLDKPVLYSKVGEGQQGITEKDLMEKELSEGGLGNGKPITILSKSMKAFNLMEGLSKFDFDKSKKEDGKTILNAYSIPKEMQGIDRDATTYENMNDSKLDMIQSIIEPISVNFSLSIQQAYNHPNRIIFDYTHLPAYSKIRKEIQETKSKRISDIIILKNEGIYSLVEAQNKIKEIEKEYQIWS